MTTKQSLIVDVQADSIQTCIDTMKDAERAYSVVDSNDQAVAAVTDNADIELVLVRAEADRISGVELCRELRRIRDRDELSILILLNENELAVGADALIAGANDLLVCPFEPRELRMRGNIVPADQVSRVDRPHTVAHENPDAAAEPQMFVPEFDNTTRSVNFGVLEGCVSKWKADPETKEVPLDKISVCPKCEGVPTFRPGCGSCGSAFVEQEVLIHHFACAHVAPEKEFLDDSNQLVCPKCRTRDLIAGSDFEQISGCHRCMDCDAIFTETKTVGHCLSCQHRFDAAEAVLKTLYAYEVGISPNSAHISAPNFQATRSGASKEVQQ